MPLDVREVELRKLASWGDRDVARAQGENLVVVVTSLGDCELSTVLGIAPRRCRFQSEWWLGQSYRNWSSVASCDKVFAKAVVRSVKAIGADYGKLPWHLVGLDGWFFYYRGASIPTWRNDVLLSATMPSKALPAALDAIRASEALLSDFATPQSGTSDSSARMRQSLGVLETAFSTESSEGTYYRTMYRHLGESDVIQQSFPREIRSAQARRLAATLAALKTLAKTPSKYERISGASRTQGLFLLNALELDHSLVETINDINSLRCKLLLDLELPQFASSLMERRIDSDGEPKRRYEYLPNDLDWMHELRLSSHLSFPAKYEASKMVGEYVARVGTTYPVLVEDPLAKVLPRLAVVSKPKRRGRRIVERVSERIARR